MRVLIDIFAVIGILASLAIVELLFFWMIGKRDDHQSGGYQPRHSDEERGTPPKDGNIAQKN